jgi:hypothetical protein
MFERFLERVSVSEYKNKFVIKGGMLIAAMVGLSARSTMDLDATIRAYPLDAEFVKTAVGGICAEDVGDGVLFRPLDAEPIRKDDDYGGFRVSMEALYDAIATPLSMDITTGDAITPGAIRYSFRAAFDENKIIELWAYNVETILAEKAETILHRGVFNTRPRDFYDIYILTNTQKFNKEVFRQALAATAEHRKSLVQMGDIEPIINNIETSKELKAQWEKYQKSYVYAENIDYKAVLYSLKGLLE